MNEYPTTPDGRYFVVRGRLWRSSNPELSPRVRQQHVSELMLARRQIKHAKQAGDDTSIKTARALIHDAKVALGARGPVWWTDQSPDLNRRMVMTTLYGEWYRRLVEQN